MKILHVPFGYYPDAVGGTEIYVATLAHALTAIGTVNVIAAPGSESTHYQHADLDVFRYAITPHLTDLDALYGTGDPVAEASFAAVLDHVQPDVVHLHALTSAISLRTVRACQQRHLPVVFTYHTPTVTCMRGTLLRWGTELCAGEMDTRLCTQCLLHKHGIRPPFNTLIAALPPALTDWARGRQGGIWTALQMHRLVDIRHTTTHEFLHAVDQIVVLCRWTQDLLLANGLPADKLHVSPHGLAANQPVSGTAADVPARPLKLAYLGRLDPVKGVDVVVRAVRDLPTAPIQLDIYGVTQPGNEAYYEQLRALAGDDARINFCPPLPNAEIVRTLRQYHALVVPSQVLETGPLVVLEAFAAGIPVIGSNLGGIAELVTPGVDGLLVDPASVSAWQGVFQQLLAAPHLLMALRANVHRPRRMADVAQEMRLIYASYDPTRG